MTIIVGQYNKGKLSIHGDRRLKGGHFNRRDDAVKITTLGETLFGYSGEYVGMEIIKEIYDMWCKDENNKFDLTTLLGIQSFVNTIKENVLVDKSEMDFMFINYKIKITIMRSGFIEEMMFFDKYHGLLLLGSGTSYALSNYATQLSHKGEVDIKDIFNVCARFDTSCGSEYDSLYLN